MRTEAEGLAEKLVYIGAMLVAHCDKFPVPSHVLAHAATATQAAAALRAQAERVRVLEGERDEATVRWCARMAEIREASGVGVKPMLDEVPGAIAERVAAAEARAEAAERRAGELEGALREAEATLTLVERPTREDPQYGAEIRTLGARIGYGALMASAQASWRMYLEASGYPLGGEHVAGPCFATVQDTLRTIRAALLPATQAEGEKP